MTAGEQTGERAGDDVSDAPGLDSIDDLCRLVLVAHRLGCKVSIEVGDPTLVELLELAGIAALVSDLRCRP